MAKMTPGRDRVLYRRLQSGAARRRAGEAHIDDVGPLRDREIDGSGEVRIIEATAGVDANRRRISADRENLGIERDPVAAEPVAGRGGDPGDLGAVAVDIVEEGGVAADDVGAGRRDVGDQIRVIDIDAGVDNRDGLAGAAEAAAIDGQGVDVAETVVELKLGGVEALGRGPRSAAAAAAARTEADQQATGRRHPSSYPWAAPDKHATAPHPQAVCNLGSIRRRSG